MPVKPSALSHTRAIYFGNILEQLRKPPDGCIDLVYVDPPFNSNRNYEVFRGYFVGFECTGNALFEIDRLRRKEGREVKARSVSEILDEEIAYNLRS